jgi:dihydrodipicolinate synthase/N-acetylneuraminate lyase
LKTSTRSRASSAVAPTSSPSTNTADQEEYYGHFGQLQHASDAFVMIYNIISVKSLGAVEYFCSMIDMKHRHR